MTDQYTIVTVQQDGRSYQDLLDDDTDLAVVQPNELFGKDSSGNPVSVSPSSISGGAQLVSGGLDTDGDPIIRVSSSYGINEDGEPYFSTEGAAPGEEAFLTIDPTTGRPTLIKVIA